MVAIPRPARPANLSPERREKVHNLLRSERFAAFNLDEAARLMYAVSGLVCDDEGHFTEDDLHAAMTDPSVLQSARALLKRAGR